MGLADVFVRYALETPQRREEQRRWEAMYGPEGFQRQKFEYEKGIEGQKLALNQNELEYRNKALQAQIKQWDEANKIARSKQEKDDLTSRMTLFNNMIDEYPESGKTLFDSLLKPYMGNVEFNYTPEGDWHLTMEDGYAFAIDRKTGKTKKEKYGEGMAGMKPKDEYSMLKQSADAILGKYGGEQFGFGQLQDAASAGDPQATQDLQDYEAIWNRMREISGLGQMPSKEERMMRSVGYSPEKYATDVARGYAQTNTGLAGMGGQPQKRIVRTGVDPDTGKRVVMYEDGTVAYAP